MGDRWELKIETSQEAVSIIQAEGSGLDDSTGEGKKCSDPGYILKIDWQGLLMDGVDMWVYVCVCVSVSVDMGTPTSLQMNQTLYR